LEGVFEVLLMTLSDWWKQLNTDLEELAKADPGIRHDKQYQAIMEAVPFGVSLIGETSYTSIRNDQKAGAAIEKIFKTNFPAPHYLPTAADRTHPETFNRSKRLIEVYINHLIRHDNVKYDDTLKGLAKMAGKNIDKLAVKMKDEYIPYLTKQIQPEPCLKPADIVVKLNQLNEDMLTQKALLVALADTTKKIQKQLAVVSANLLVRMFSYFHIKLPQQRKLETMLARAEEDRTAKNDDISKMLTKSKELKKQYISVDTITEQVTDWSKLDEKSQDVVKDMLNTVIERTKAAEYNNPVEIANMLAEKIQKAMYGKTWGQSKGIYVKNHGYVAHRYASLFDSSAILDTENLVADVIKIGKATPARLLPPLRA
jgi:hypothetical protein